MSITETLHYVCFGLLITAAFVAVVVGVERLIFSLSNLRRANKLLSAMDNKESNLVPLIGNDIVSNLVREIKHSSDMANEAEKQDFVDAAYLRDSDDLFNRMWILDTDVTVARLDGVLGTIFGIVETFLVLAEAAMSAA